MLNVFDKYAGVVTHLRNLKSLIVVRKCKVIFGPVKICCKNDTELFNLDEIVLV